MFAKYSHFYISYRKWLRTHKHTQTCIGARVHCLQANPHEDHTNLLRLKWKRIENKMKCNSSIQTHTHLVKVNVNYPYEEKKCFDKWHATDINTLYLNWMKIYIFCKCRGVCMRRVFFYFFCLASAASCL